MTDRLTETPMDESMTEPTEMGPWMIEPTTITTRPPSGKSYRLTQRDIAMLDTVSTARFITAEALEWLHIPGWLERWQTHHETGHGPYLISRYLYVRLRFLLRESCIARFRRSMQMTTNRFGRESDIYLLTEYGARILAETRHRSLDTVSYTRHRPRSYFTLTHGVEIGTLYAALRAKMAMTTGIAMEGWMGEHLTAKGFDRILVRRRTRAGQPEHVKLPVQPDAAFVWKHPHGAERIFVEIDRGTRSLATWIEKIQAYQAYMGSPELKARYDADSFMVLTVAPTEAQRHALMQATASVIGKPHGRYLFGLQETVHPTTIGQGWMKLASVTPTGNPLKPVITMERHQLLPE